MKRDGTSGPLKAPREIVGGERDETAQEKGRSRVPRTGKVAGVVGRSAE